MSDMINSRAMQKFTDVFGSERVFLPVIHVGTDDDLTISNMDMVRNAGADGVFLISHGDVDAERLVTLHSIFTEQWDRVGLNLLGTPTSIAMRIMQVIKRPGIGLWTDTMGVNTFDADEAQKFYPHFDPLLFGGVAFKYQPRVAQSDLTSVTQHAAQYMDVITTSGPGTAQPANIEKVQIMSQAVPNVPLALASGVDIHNVDSYLPYVNAFLVSSSICVDGDFYRLDANRTRALADRIHGRE